MTVERDIVNNNRFQPPIAMSSLTTTTLAVLLLSLTSPAVAAEPIFVPGENLTIQGIPPVPQRLVDRVNRYTNFRSASLASWHPKKREILISTRFGDVAQVHQVSMPLGMRKQLTFFPERVGNGSYAPIGGNYFIFSKDIGGNEFNQTFRYDLENGNTTDRKSTRLNSSHRNTSRMPSSA